MITVIQKLFNQLVVDQAGSGTHPYFWAGLILHGEV